MNRGIIRALFVVTMIVVVVGVDLLFFRHHLALRLLGNIGIVLLFVAIYLGLLRDR